MFGVLAVQGWTTCVLLNKGMGRVLGGRAANLVSVFAAFASLSPSVRGGLCRFIHPMFTHPIKATFFGRQSLMNLALTSYL